MKNKSENPNHEQQIRNTRITDQKNQIEKPRRSSTTPDLPNPGAKVKVGGGSGSEVSGEATHGLDWTQASNPMIWTEPKQRPLLSKTSMAELPWLFLRPSSPPSVVWSKFHLSEPEPNPLFSSRLDLAANPLLSSLWVFFESLIWVLKKNEKGRIVGFMYFSESLIWSLNKEKWRKMKNLQKSSLLGSSSQRNRVC